MFALDYARLFHAVPGLFLVLAPDHDFTILDASDAYLRATFTQRENIVGRPLFEVFPDNPAQLADKATANLRASLERVVASKTEDVMPLQRYDVRRPARPSEEFVERWWSPVNVPLLDASGAVEVIIHRVEGATELHRMRRTEERERRKLVEANNRFQAVYDQGLFAGLLTLDGTLIDVNRSALEQCGFTRDDVLGKPFWECGWWNRAPEVQAWIKDGVARARTGEPFRGQSTYFWADGSQHVVEFACMPIKDDGGNVIYLAPTGMDISARVAAETNLRATEILDSITEGFFTLGRDYRFGFVNREALRILDRPANDLAGKLLWEVYPGLEGTEFERVYRHCMTERETTSFTAYYPQHERWYEVTVYPAATGIAVYFRDVTPQKRAESERERLITDAARQTRIYETALSNTPDFVYIFDLDHRFIYANEALLEMFGVTREQAMTMSWQELGYEQWHSDMHDREIDLVIQTGKAVRGEVPFNGTAGRRIYDYIFAPVFGPDGAVVAVAGTTRDITERKQAELAIREQAERLVEADRAKDEFLATLSHELRNPLAPLRNSLALLRQSGPTDERLTRVHGMMDRQVNHLVRLVDDLLEVSRVTSGSFSLRKERIDLGAVVRNAVETSEPVIHAAGHRLAVSLPAEPLLLECDPVRIAQIISNLLNNAANYTDRTGTIALDAARVGDTVRIRVTDDGVGLSPDALSRLFRMFSRGERVDRRHQGGLGVGLALGRRLAEMHDGTLDAASEGLGKGSTFTLTIPLPVQPAPVESRDTDGERAIAPTRVLVVDDNVDSAESLGMLLEVQGVDVRLAHDGPAALVAFGEYLPSVVLLDIGMPDMDGYEVARAIRERFPTPRPTLIALTGWGQEKDRRQAREAGFDHHVVKPVEIGALRALLASVQATRS